MRKTILVLGLAVLAVGLLAVASQYKAEQVIFDDAEDLQAKFDAGDLGSGGGGGGTGALYSAQAGSGSPLTLSSSFQLITNGWSDGYDPGDLFTPSSNRVCNTSGTAINALIAIAFSSDVDAIVTNVEYAIGTGDTGSIIQTGEVFFRDHHTASSVGMGVVMIGATLTDNECVALMARHASATDDLSITGATLNIWEAGGSSNVHTDDVTVSGILTVDGLQITNNTDGNVFTLLDNNESGTDHTCATKGVTGTLGILDTDDTFGVQNWELCDGQDSLGNLSGLYWADVAMQISATGTVDSYTCPLLETQETALTNALTGNGSCMVPEGYETRFHRLESMTLGTLSNDTEECQVSIVYNNTDPSSTDPVDLDGIVQASGGGDGIVFPQETNCATFRVRGYKTGVELDRTDTVTGYWALHTIASTETGGCTCSKMDAVQVSVAYELLPVNP